jgi:hypothetical protein
MASEVSNLRRQRGTFKAKITSLLRRLEGEVPGIAERLAVDEQVNAHLKEIARYDNMVTNLMLKEVSFDDTNGESELDDSIVRELDSQESYTIDIKTKLAAIPKERVAKDNSSENLCDLRLPYLQCPTFSGEGKSVMEYQSFETQFQNIIGSRKITNSSKLIYLKSYVVGYASKLLSHLQISDENYLLALELLRKEFLNKTTLRNELYRKLIDCKLIKSSEVGYTSTKIDLSNIRCILADLVQHGRDLLKDEASNEFISHIVISKLPYDFKLELVRKLNNNYPSVEQVLDNYDDIIVTLNMNNTTIIKGQERKPLGYTVGNFRKPFASANEGAVGSSGLNRTAVNCQLGNNSKINSFQNTKNCKFCGSPHSMLSCQKYGNYNARVARCKELILCPKCTSSKHDNNCNSKLDYGCVSCKSHEHISALCNKIKSKVSTNWCLNSTNSSEGGSNILPTLTVEVGRGIRTTKVRCLLDSGSQKSYLSANVLQKLKFPKPECEQQYMVHSFLDSGMKSFSEVSLQLKLGNNKYHLPLLIDETFKLKYSVDYLDVAINNLKSQYRLADESYYLNQNPVILEGLLGVDTLQ